MINADNRTVQFPELRDDELVRARDCLARVFPPATIQGPGYDAEAMLFAAGQHDVVRAMTDEIEARKRDAEP